MNEYRTPTGVRALMGPRGSALPEVEETAMTDTTTTAHGLPDATGRLLYLARNSRDASQKAAARAELVRRGLDPRNGAKTTPKESA